MTIYSCDFINKRRSFHETKSRIDKLYGKTLVLPDTLNILYHNQLMPCKKTNLLHGELFIVSRISGTCARCVHNLKIWEEELINHVDTSRIKFLFYIYSDDYKYFKNIFYPEINHDYPLLIDTKDSFIVLNKLTEYDSRFHTFLLDENHNIKLVGSPLFNNEMKELYFREIEKIYSESG